MIQRTGNSTLQLDPPVYILGSGSCAGKKEGEGPLASYFDAIYSDTLLGMDTWEQAESRLQTEAVKTALHKAGLQPSDIQYIFAGDLLNQCISSTYGLRDMNIPFLGQYGACSTMAQTMGMAAAFVAGGAAENAAAVTSSHFCSAERQFRFPLEYGGQRTPTSQWTTTGAGSVILGKRSAPVSITEVTFGRMTDLGVNDANNMGAAMAPAAVRTLTDYLTDTDHVPADFDLILTGDLGYVGSRLLRQMMRKAGWDIETLHNDCGLMIYDRKKQDVHAGGSGCGCSGSVVCGYILRQLEAGVLHDVLFLATGALMSPTALQQGENIVGISHLVHLHSDEPPKES
ncbi:MULTISPECIES: stage V sporulation protein AD [Caproicibacterium]|uniref:Stage V sporulation protein AD n=1 Tax=Caproicibacterium lactatifermentans TaxID=2666138 RepID=A0A859DR27_9FIRM|nr:stage V sporulation protein AD [Caproicibacterium lactatifermentans]ARP51031.1 stage V sporulation protein AD [Ruminococcaceae bacterium CPB6]MDD4807405.1 stage V sporulation protein AD [Oscillospiraceae bacterium]QKN23242.1 stage V sporulation protein AD [Caproicibacterium lactatifermentans]QKO30076.1 stage V sporulation protein AD [Caproicibacterium lactatifermentans]